MSNNSKLHPQLIALLGAMLGGSVLPVEVREGESVEDAIERAHAEHRAGCKDCQEAHDAEQAQGAAKAADTSIVGEMREKLKAKHEHEREVLAKKHAAERESLGKSFAADERTTGMRPEMAAPYGQAETNFDGSGQKTAPGRTPIGFMAFHVTPDGTARAIPPSFNEDRDAVQAAMEEVEEHPLAMLLSGLSGTSVEVRPVFGE